MKTFQCSPAALGVLTLLAAQTSCLSETSDKTPVGEARIALTQAPPNLRCLRVTVTGVSRSSQQLFSLDAGQSSASLPMSGLPLGDDTFGAEAFEIDCKSVAAASVAEWIGEVAASVVKDQVTDVTISMKRNGQGAVSLDFPDEPGCSAPGVACLHGTECCSGTCNDGTCAVANCTSYAYTGNPFVVGTGNVTAQVVFDATPTPGFTGVLGIEHVVSWHIASSPIDVSSATPAQEPDATGFFPLQFAFDNGVIESWQFAQGGQAGYKIYTLKDSTTLNGKTEDGAQDAKQVNRHVTSNAGSWAPACN